MFVDHAAPNTARQWTTARPRTGTTRRWEDAAVESQIETRRRVITGSGVAWGCSRWRITGGVEGWWDNLADGVVVLRSDAC